MYIDLLRASGMRSEGNPPPKKKKVEDQRSFSFSRQCSSAPVDFGKGLIRQEQCDTTGAHTLLTWQQLIFICPSIEINIDEAALFDATHIIKNGTEEPKGFKMASSNVSNTFAVAGRSV
jgi:hypothetical protein